MGKIRVISNEEEINATEVIRGKKIVPFGKDGAHITVAKKHIGENASVIIEAPTGSYIEAIRKFQTKKR